MELKHYINDVEIEEPIGFDEFKTILKRHENHGVGVEMSVGDLEFYGSGFGIVQTAYETDIDTVLTYKAEKKCDGSDTFEPEYEGQIDLSTYNSQTSTYCSCSCKVAEIGVKTTFNNRVETDVAIDSLVSLDGDVLPSYSNLNKEITLPSKVIQLRNKLFADATISTDGYVENFVNILPALNAQLCADWGGSDTQADNSFIHGPSSTFQFENPLLIQNYTIKYDLHFEAVKVDNVSDALTAQLIIKKKIGGTTTTIYTSTPESIEYGQENRLDYNGAINITDAAEFIQVLLLISNNLGNIVSIQISTTALSYVQIHYNSTVADTKARVYMLHELFSRISEAICGLKVRSDYFGRFNSNVNPLEDLTVGDGALKCITDGLKIRNAYYTGGTIPKFTLSFKDLFTNINAIDNIGFGFSTEVFNVSIQVDLQKSILVDDFTITFIEDIPTTLSIGDRLAFVDGVSIGTVLITGITAPKTITFDSDIAPLFDNYATFTFIGSETETGDFMMVEKWAWFYKAATVLVLNNPTRKQRKLNESSIKTRLKCGYEKFGETDDYNSIDTFHTQRNYITKLKSIDKDLVKVSKFIACPYAIETTRRKALDKTTKDWKYDNDKFVIVLKMHTSGALTVDVGVNAVGETIISPETIYNARISPLNNASKHAERLFEINSPITSLMYASGSGNIDAEYQPIESVGYFYLQDTLTGQPNKQDDSIAKINPILKPEIIEFEYPLAKSEYELIKLNPYSIIEVDGEKTYLSEISRHIATGLATFKVIPKYE